MPEYLHPGVYIEETSYRSKSIEGVATSTTGFVGQAAFGPVSGVPTLVTSFEEYQRTFGDIGDLDLNIGSTTNYLAHAVRAYFDNGGKRVYISRVFKPTGTTTVPPADTDIRAACADGATSFAGGASFRARWPGQAGELDVTVRQVEGRNLLVTTGVGAPRVSGLRKGDLVRTAAAADTVGAAPNAWALRDADGNITLTSDGTTAISLAGLASVVKVAYVVEVSGGGRSDAYGDLSTHPDASTYIGTALRQTDPYDAAGRVSFEIGTITDADVLALATALRGWATQTLTGGSDGDEMDSDFVRGGGEGDTVTGLVALGEVDDIAIVAAPGGSALTTTGEPQLVRDALLSHCENLKYRFAVLSAPNVKTTAAIREARALHDSTYGALYYPWVVVKDPNGAAGQLLELPPDGFMCGIYARSDIERGVHKAPANEVVRGVLRFAVNVNEATQDTLNPEGINCLRFFEGRGYRVWGARTLTSDPEWKYVNVRRLFIFLEHSIDRATQWVVFEPNNETLWLKVRMTIESFLVDVWRTGALMGTQAKEAFFVRCDRTTMTQGDLDNGRLVCLIGVAPTKPAEFVIFRIGQWTADSSIV